MTSRFITLTAGLLLATATLAAHAQTDTTAASSTPAPVATAAPAIQGDAKAGEELIYTCTGCHGVIGYKNAYPNYHVPKIGGQNYQYIVSALSEYKAGTRAHPTMRAQAEGFSEQDIHNIAAFLSSLTEAAK